MTFLDGQRERAFAVLRILSGLLFLAHGVQKFLGFPVAVPYPLTPMLNAAGAIEIIAGALIAIGLFTRPAAFIASGMSAVGYWTVHAANGPFPISNGGETIVLYCFLFLYIAARGAGIWSIDAARTKGK